MLFSLDVSCESRMQPFLCRKVACGGRFFDCCGLNELELNTALVKRQCYNLYLHLDRCYTPLLNILQPGGLSAHLPGLALPQVPASSMCACRRLMQATDMSKHTSTTAASFGHLRTMRTRCTCAHKFPVATSILLHRLAPVAMLGPDDNAPAGAKYTTFGKKHAPCTVSSACASHHRVSRSPCLFTRRRQPPRVPARVCPGAAEMADEDEKEVSVKFITSLDREYRVPEAPMVRGRGQQASSCPASSASVPCNYPVQR
jgi:hypothetical protein